MDSEDLEIIEAFVTESTELLNSLDQDLITLEQNPDSPDLLHRIFRSFHTVKGGANFFKEHPAFAQIGKIAHASEDIMGEIRNGKNHITPEMMDVILKGVETIKRLINQIRVSQFDAPDYSELVQRLRSFLVGEVKKEEGTVSPTAPTSTPPPSVAKPTSAPTPPPGAAKPAPPSAAAKPPPQPPPATATAKPAPPPVPTPLPAVDKPTPPPSAVVPPPVPPMPPPPPPLTPMQPSPPPSDLSPEDFLEIAQAFLVEAREIMDKLEQNLVELEQNPNNQDLLNAIFRGMHTIKGNAKFLSSDANFFKIAMLAHATEDLIGAKRQEQLVITPEIMDIILQAVGMIRALLQSSEQNQQSPLDHNPVVRALRDVLAAVGVGPSSKPSTPPSSPVPVPSQHVPIQSAQPAATTTPSVPVAPQIMAVVSPPAPITPSPAPVTPAPAPPPQPSAPVAATPAKKTEAESLADDEDLTKDFLDESRELTQHAENDLAKLEKNPQDQKLLEQVFRSMHTLKSTTAFLGYQKISDLARQAEEIMSKVSKASLTFEPRIMTAMLEAIEFFKGFFQRLEQGNKDQGDPQAIIQKLQQCLTPSKSISPNTPPIAPPPPAAVPAMVTSKPPEPSAAPAASPASTSAAPPPAAPIVESTITIEANRLDSLMNLVGELVLGRNRLSQLVRELSEKVNDDRLTQDLTGAVDFLDFVTSDLQRAVLKTRMQPVRNIFNRFPTNIRSLARELGKEVKLITSGAETELDKSVIQPLSESLTHLLRNAVDHGIESPEARRKAGKNPTGTIALSASYEGNYILIRVQDDGKGINHEIIKAKAIEKGLLTQEAASRLPPKEIIDYIFAPGFSTAEKITGTSGRGVGMDVVKTKVEGLGGSVEINTIIGYGTTFILRIPLTLAIIQALHVQVNSEIYAIPLSSVIETLRLYRGQIETVSGHEVVRFRNSIIPLIRLRDVFDVPGTLSSSDKIYVVVAGIADKQIGLTVDKIVGQEEVVVKSMGKLLENTTGISGACIGGDGKITLIVDLAGVLRLIPYNIGATVAAATAKLQETQEGIKRSSINTVLLAEDSRSERKRARILLEQKGYRVIEAADGKEALSKLSDYQVDLVITDIEMPELDGYRLTAKIRENRKFKFLPVIAISSHKEMIDRIKGMEAGINLYLPKPLHEDDLFSAIKSLLS